MEAIIALVAVGGYLGLCLIASLKGRGLLVLAAALSIPVLAFVVAWGLFEMATHSTPVGLKVAGGLIGAFTFLAPLVAALLPATPSSRWSKRHQGP